MYFLNLTLEKIAKLCCYHLKIILIADVLKQLSLMKICSLFQSIRFVCVCVCMWGKRNVKVFLFAWTYKRREFTEKVLVFPFRQKWPTCDLLVFQVIAIAIVL